MTLTLDQIKAEMRKYLTIPKLSYQEKAYDEVTQRWLKLLEDLAPDAKLRRVREKIVGLGNFTIDKKSKELLLLESEVLDIIDAELKEQSSMEANLNKGENKMKKEKTSTGSYSTGDCSTGHFSTGNRSTGHCSTGDCSTGSYSTGHCSTGDCSTGDCSTGNRSTGHFSTGHFSTGNRSTGDCSTGDYSVGHFCTEDFAPHGWFNVASAIKWSDIEAPHFYEFYLTKWIDESKMTTEEKKNNSTFHTTKGYLKTFTYKEAWANLWRDTNENNRKKFLALPHFDAAIFKEITGIDLEVKTCEGKIVEMDSVKYKLVRA